MLESGSSYSALGPGSRLSSGPGTSHCVVFLGKTLYSHIASLHPGELWVTLRWTSISSTVGGEGGGREGDSRNIFRCFMPQKLGKVDHLAVCRLNIL